MSDFGVGFASLAGMLVLIYLGMHVAVALAVSSFVSVWIMKGNAVLAAKLLALSAADGISNYIFGVVPLFVLMGLFVSVADIGRDAFDAADTLFRKVIGGLGIATVAANAVFAAITGISIASAAVFTQVAVPQMIRCGYRPRFAVGVVAGSSVLGMLIPPSLLMIIYGVLAEVSIGDLFIAGIIPGLLLSAVFAVGILLMARFMPRFVGTDIDDTADPRPLLNRRQIARKLSPIGILVVLVLGGIYGGVFTPTEAGAAGALGAGLIALVTGRLNRAGVWRVLSETGHITASICLLFIAATMYSRMLSISGLPSYLGDFFSGAGLGLYTIIAIYVVIVIVLGTVLDSSSIMLVMLPLVIPVLIPMEVDLIWFGIITVIAVEIGLLTPPLGIAVYVIKATLDDSSITLNDIFTGAAPFALMMLAVLIAVIAVPWLAIGLV